MHAEYHGRECHAASRVLDVTSQSAQSPVGVQSQKSRSLPSSGVVALMAFSRVAHALVVLLRERVGRVCALATASRDEASLPAADEMARLHLHP